MPIIDQVDETILNLISSLVAEHSASGFLSAATSERKNEIIEQIATLRAAMTPQCTCQKD